MKIVIVGICKNEAKFAQRFADSVKNADGVYIADTGSTDGTQEILKSNGISVEDVNISPFRFDLARNMSMLQIPQDADVAISMDLDDILAPNFRELIEKNWVLGETTCINYPYTHAWMDEEQTKPRITIWGFKVLDPKKYIWKYPIHEIPVLKDGLEEKKVIIEESILIHHPDIEKDERKNRVWIFEQHKEEYKADSRMVHLHAREYYLFGEDEKALPLFKEYLRLTYLNEKEESLDGGIKQSRAYADRCIAKILENKQKKEETNNYSEILEWYLKSVSDSPFQREPWMHLAYMWYRLGDGLNAFAAASKGMEITERLNSIELEGICWDEDAQKLFDNTRVMMEQQAKPYTNEIDGWMSSEELVLLNNLAKETNSIVEIGSWKGKSTHALLSGCKGIVTAVDHFKGTVSDGDAHKEAFEDSESVYKQFVDNVGHFINLKIIKNTSEEAVANFEDKSIDMVFIDGEHTFESVRKDIDIWFPKTKKIICGHDYNFEGVKEAVNKAFNKVETIGSIWIYRILNN